MKNNGEWGGIVELIEFSSIIDIKIELWTDISDSAPYLTIGYANNQNVIKLLYSNWCHYSPLILSSSNSLISRKNKLIKGKKYWSCQKYCLKIQKSHWVNPKCMNWYFFNQLDEFPPNLSAHLNSSYFYEEKYQYLAKTEKKYPERLKKGLASSNSKQLLTYKNRQRTFLKTIKVKGIE